MVKTKYYNIARFPRTTFPVQAGKRKHHPTLTSCILLSDYFLNPSSVTLLVIVTHCLALLHIVSAEPQCLFFVLSSFSSVCSFPLPTLGSDLRLMAISESPTLGLQYKSDLATEKWQQKETVNISSVSCYSKW